MIGTLLCYALYPLSRYLTGRSSEASKKGVPPAVINGTAVWDGGAVTTRRFTQAQTTLLDQWPSPHSGTEAEAKERMKEPRPEKENDGSDGKDGLVTGLQEETKGGDASKVSGVQPAAEEKEAEMGGEEERVDALGPEGGRITIHPGEQHTEDESIFPSEDISPEETLQTQLECLRTEDNTQKTTCLAKEKTCTQSLEELVTPALTSMQESACPEQEQAQIITSLGESATAAEAAAEITECWDEYVAPAAGEMHGGELFASLLSDDQTHFNFSEHRDAQASWHFPAGPGLAEEVRCPLLQFPAVSYYPPAEPTVPFEVMWRVWEMEEGASAAAQTALTPFPFTKPVMNFTVMSYNILADDLLLANQELYTHCPLEVLDWHYRYSLLLEEILKWTPDILCLQEVQENHYREQLCPVLSQMGYTCVYKRRTGTKTDGCATCYRGSCFSEVSVTLLEYFRPEMELLDRHNVGIVLLLRPVVAQGSEVKAKGPPLCVANTHLLFNPRRGDVKLAQLAIMLAELDRVVKSCRAEGEHCNLILCGDFNSVPHMPLYQLITTGELYFQGLPAWMISGQEDLSYKTHCYRLFAPLWPPCLGISDSCQYTLKETFKSQKPGKCQFSHDFLLQLRFCPAACVRPVDLELIPGVTDNTPDASRGNQPNEKRFRHALSHRLNLESVYKHVLPGSGSPEVTTLHSEGGATVDYIFYTPRSSSTTDERAAGDSVSEGLKLVGSLSLLSEDVLWSMRGLPNHRFPSDHLSLLAKFQLDLNAA